MTFDNKVINSESSSLRISNNYLLDLIWITSLWRCWSKCIKILLWHMSEFEISGRVRHTSMERQVRVLDYLYDFDLNFCMRTLKLNNYVFGFLFVKFFYFYILFEMYIMSTRLKSKSLLIIKLSKFWHICLKLSDCWNYIYV